MNPVRLLITTVVATIADMVYGFLVYGLLLGPTFDQYPAVYRGSADTSHIGYLVLGVFFVMLAVSFIYIKGYDGGSPVAEGLRFGGVVGTLVVGTNIIYYAILNIGRKIALMASVAGFVEFLIIGIVIAFVSKPSRPGFAKA